MRNLGWLSLTGLLVVACGQVTERQTPFDSGSERPEAASGGAAGGGTGGSTGTGGAGGTAGTGGAAGTGGSGGRDAGTDIAIDSADVRVDQKPDTDDICRALVTEYQAAMVEAKQCNPLSRALQCRSTVNRSLTCPGCVTHVQVDTALAEIQKRYSAANCRPLPCPAIACPAPGVGVCMANDGGGGGGTCTDIYPMNGSSGD